GGARDCRSTRALAFDPLHGVLHELRGRAQIELCFYACAVGLDGLHGEMEPLGDVACAQATTGELEDLQLAIAEDLQGRLAGLYARHHAQQHAFLDLVAHVHPATKHMAHSLYDDLIGLQLHDVAACSGPDRPFSVQGFVVA